ncbi:hypothetical protein STRTUCAR8_00186 [Streptomyces turgidiscabies Car8]|uniref:Uncharacterized protein n=1 Tax=Streptomyces turgidiscabies (strain Car8) TaxID=698760 RepID=L7EUU0_STRT8|nr:hypothetical protein STRTUCAR8_00186 [Streptomyces turgidiscabies Car8]
MHSGADLRATVRSGLLRAVRPLVVMAHRVHYVGVVLFGVAVRADAGVVGRFGERVLEVAQPLGREIEGLHVRAGFPQGPQRRQVDRLPRCGLRLLVVVFGVGGRGRKRLLGHRRLLVRDDVVRPAPHDGGGAQLLPHHHTGEDGPLVPQREAGILPLPRSLVRGPGRSRLAGIGRRLPVRVGSGSWWAAAVFEV